MSLPVSIQALPDYQPDRVEAALQALLAPLGGMQAFIKPGQRVLLKPNLLAGKPPDKAVTTHPEIVRQTILMAQACGGIVSVGDSPGIGKAETVARKSGILSVIEETGARFAPFDESTTIHPHGTTFHSLEVASAILEADVIINLPKLKTHQMMGLTAAVKNMFGVVVGMRKVRLHLQAGTDKAFFALMLLELAEQVQPALSIVDAVVAMEGEGPGSGDPVQVGALLAGPHPLAVDTSAADLLGLPADLNLVQKIAREKGRVGAELADVDLRGDTLENLRPA
ncbi:MAG: (4Fe-4S)-binding protein, partial [Desulfuromonas sp.]